MLGDLTTELKAPNEIAEQMPSHEIAGACGKYHDWVDVDRGRPPKRTTEIPPQIATTTTRLDPTFLEWQRSFKTPCALVYALPRDFFTNGLMDHAVFHNVPTSPHAISEQQFSKEC